MHAPDSDPAIIAELLARAPARASSFLGDWSVWRGLVGVAELAKLLGGDDPSSEGDPVVIV